MYVPLPLLPRSAGCLASATNWIYPLLSLSSVHCCLSNLSQTERLHAEKVFVVLEMLPAYTFGILTFHLYPFRSKKEKKEIIFSPFGASLKSSGLRSSELSSLQVNALVPKWHPFSSALTTLHALQVDHTRLPPFTFFLGHITAGMNLQQEQCESAQQMLTTTSDHPNVWKPQVSSSSTWSRCHAKTSNSQPTMQR